MRRIIRPLILFSIGGLIYLLIEILWRGHTNWTMFIVGGLCFYFVGLINEVFTFEMPLALQMFIGSLIITCVEFVSGVVINIVFKMNVWDYSHLPFNILGQICLPFTFLWFLLSFVAILLDDYLRYWLFGEEKPEYYLFGKNNNRRNI